MRTAFSVSAAGGSRITLLVTARLLVGLLWVVRERYQNRLAVENRSGQAVAFLRVTIAGETIPFRDVRAGAEVTATFRIKTKDHFVVEGRLADGTRVGGEFGYVGNGMHRERAHFVILPDGEIEFRQSNTTTPY
jgi:hypothetical protein